MVTESTTHPSTTSPPLVQLCIVLALLWFMRGFTLMLLWRWLIVPIFALNPLSHAEAIGLAYFLAFALGHLGKKDLRNVWVILGGQAILNISVILFGWLMASLI